MFTPDVKYYLYCSESAYNSNTSLTTGILGKPFLMHEEVET